MRARGTSATVTAASANGGWQPLCAIYRREFADAAEQALQSGNYKIAPLFAPSFTNRVGEQDLADAGFPPDIFRNLNSPEELAALTGRKNHQ
jgi:molybdopterin-guanine dinucleotide biosynthesis protein A